MVSTTASGFRHNSSSRSWREIWPRAAVPCCAMAVHLTHPQTHRHTTMPLGCSWAPLAGRAISMDTPGCCSCTAWSSSHQLKTSSRFTCTCCRDWCKAPLWNSYLLHTLLEVTQPTWECVCVEFHLPVATVECHKWQTEAHRGWLTQKWPCSRLSLHPRGAWGRGPQGQHLVMWRHCESAVTLSKDNKTTFSVPYLLRYCI